jgi:hypothetical protein
MNMEHGMSKKVLGAGGLELKNNEKFDIKHVESGMDNISWLNEDL